MLCGSLWGFAQKTDVLMATLQHGEQVRVYYGTDAFKAAYEAAADSGDVITLSAGTFDTPYRVQKSLTIIGAGFVTDVEKGVYPTILSGSITFAPRDAVNEDGDIVKNGISVNGTRLEGLLSGSWITFDGSRRAENIQLVKCNVAGVSCSSPVKGMTVRQCRVGTVSWPYESSIGTNVLFINSIVGECTQSAKRESTLFFKNCIVNTLPGNAYTYENCILGRAPKDGSTVNHCILMKNNEGVYLGTGNWSNKQYAGIFAEEMTDLNWAEGKTYTLKYPDSYKGTDGTQVGIYGGAYPYNPTPSTPQITACEIDNTTAADGTIKVNITVEAQTED